MRVTYDDPATAYAALEFGDEFLRPRGTTMDIETITANVAAGVLIAGLVIAIRVGHCFWFAVDCL